MTKVRADGNQSKCNKINWLRRLPEHGIFVVRCLETYGVELRGGNSNIALLFTPTLVFHEKKLNNAKRKMVAMKSDLLADYSESRNSSLSSAVLC